MNIEGLEIKINKQYGTITYWKDGVIIGRKCTMCGEDKEINEFNFLNKKKGVYNPKCKECRKRYRETNKEHLKEKSKQYYEANKDYRKEYQKQYREANKEIIKEKDKRYREVNKERLNERSKQYREANKEHIKQYREANKDKIKEYGRQYNEINKEFIKERRKRHYEVNKERISERHKQYYGTNKEKLKEKSKQYRKAHKEIVKEYNRQYNETIKNNNIEEITKMLYQLNPILSKLNIKAYGSIYKITNIKTGRRYIGQTTKLLKHRYNNDIIKGWVEERKRKTKQKFTEELIENDFILETIDYGICQYHLDKLEVMYINQYDSCNNGYNNQLGNHRTDDGIEEFNQILSDHNLEFVDGKLIQIKSTHQHG